MNASFKQNCLLKTRDFVKKSLSDAEGGHDWWHVYRVWQLSRQIARTEPVDLFVVELGALLHDIADHKFHGGDEEIGPRTAGRFLDTLNVSGEVVEHVGNIIANISFKGGKHPRTFHSRELDVVQDADRLDAMGAIGVARAFNYGGYRGRPMHDPDAIPDSGMAMAAYKSSHSPTINHFHEKLLLLKDRMNTPAGKAMAAHRHQYMERFLEEFFLEWNGNV